MTGKDLTIRHFGDTDTLVLYTEDLSTEGETVAPDLSVHYNRDGEVMSIVIEHAVKQLTRYLFPGHVKDGMDVWDGRDMEIAYTPETDTLTLQTGEPPYAGYTEKTVAPGLRVNFDPEGWAMGVVIEGAAELLRPYLVTDSVEVGQTTASKAAS